MASVDRTAQKSQELYERAMRTIPGGVNSPVRAFRAVGSSPRFVERAAGSRLFDVDGREYIDLVGSWGPLILGHAHPEILKAVAEAAQKGTSFGAPTEGEIELAEQIVAAVPGIEKVRLVNSGTEATMSAIRLARGATGRDLVIKFEGCYHGHGDSFLIQAGSGAATLGHPSSPGVTAGTARDTLVAEYNDADQVERLFESHRGKIAAVIVEPVAANMGLVLPEEGFLERLRTICDQEGACLIFDEVITGFRLGFGGAQERYRVRPDLTTLGKVIGGGLPVGAYGGRSDLMDHLAPDGPVYQAGTLSGNPLAVAAGRAMLRLLEDATVYARLEARAARLRTGIEKNIVELAVEATYVGTASLGCLYFRKGAPRNWAEVAQADTKRFALYFQEMLGQGIHIAPSQFEVGFLSDAHTDDDVDRVVAANRVALATAFGVGR